LLFFFVTTISCQKEVKDSQDNLNNDIKGSNDSIDLRNIEIDQFGVKNEQSGMEIEFCLLNEDYQPDSIFDFGENFKFFLSITNNVEPDSTMFIVSDFLVNPNLFMVFDSHDEKIGKPIDWYAMYKRSDAPNEVMKNHKWIMVVPWHEVNFTEEPFNSENLLHFFQHFFIGLDQPYLESGKYYTKFIQAFCLGRHHNSPEYDNDPLVCTDTLTFKISFEIR
jgi:hypothetical protein